VTERKNDEVAVLEEAPSQPVVRKWCSDTRVTEQSSTASPARRTFLLWLCGKVIWALSHWWSGGLGVEWGHQTQAPVSVTSVGGEGESAGWHWGHQTEWTSEVFPVPTRWQNKEANLDRWSLRPGIPSERAQHRGSQAWPAGSLCRL
jgi:hypothetical protein